MNWDEYGDLLKELEWLRREHPEKKRIITFIEEFCKFVSQEGKKHEPKQMQVSPLQGWRSY
jgi:hypothetical protein